MKIRRRDYEKDNNKQKLGEGKMIMKRLITICVAVALLSNMASANFTANGGASEVGS
jgi:hypothetical protein